MNTAHSPLTLRACYVTAGPRVTSLTPALIWLDADSMYAVLRADGHTPVLSWHSGVSRAAHVNRPCFGLTLSFK